MDTRPVKKTKKSKSSITSTTTTSSKPDIAQDKGKVKREKKRSDKKSDKRKKDKKDDKKKKDKKEDKKKSKKDTLFTETSIPRTEPTKKQRSSPFDGLERTKKRNMRKRLIKQRYRMLQEDSVAPAVVEVQEEPVVDQQNDAVHELHVENLQITRDEPSEKLLKKNKNKKKNHLKGSKADNRSHVYYQEQQQQAVEEQSAVTENEIGVGGTRQNLYGRAFITSNESEPKYKGYRMPENHLPIHQMPTLFYANNPNHDNQLVSSESTSAPVAEIDVASISHAAVEDEPVDYEKLPVADFESNIPCIGDQLAIKVRSHV